MHVQFSCALSGTCKRNMHAYMQAPTRIYTPADTHPSLSKGSSLEAPTTSDIVRKVGGDVDTWGVYGKLQAAGWWMTSSSSRIDICACTLHGWENVVSEQQKRSQHWASKKKINKEQDTCSRSAVGLGWCYQLPTPDRTAFR